LEVLFALFRLDFSDFCPDLFYKYSLLSFIEGLNPEEWGVRLDLLTKKQDVKTKKQDVKTKKQDFKTNLTK